MWSVDKYLHRQNGDLGVIVFAVFVSTANDLGKQDHLYRCSLRLEFMAGGWLGPSILHNGCFEGYCVGNIAVIIVFGSWWTFHDIFGLLGSHFNSQLNGILDETAK